MRARFVELAPEGFEEVESSDTVELAAYGEAGERVLAGVSGARAVTEVEDGWEDRWREFHRPVQIGRSGSGRPGSAAPSGSLAVVIDPGRAFGTGAHPTTRLCLELLLEHPAGSLLDVGCGSGVLSIAAARLGFAPVDRGRFDDRGRGGGGRTPRRTASRSTYGSSMRSPTSCPKRRRPSRTSRSRPWRRSRRASPWIGSSHRATSHRTSRAIPGFTQIARRELDGWAADLYLRP